MEPSSSITDSTYNTQTSNHWGEAYRSRQYVLTLGEVRLISNDTSEVYTFENSSSLDERLALSYINLNNVVPEVYDLNATALTPDEYEKIKEWRKCIKKNRFYFPPGATTVNQLIESIKLDSQPGFMHSGYLQWICENRNPIRLNHFKKLILTPREGRFNRDYEKYYYESRDQTSEIGFTIENVSPVFKYLFPALDKIQVKWEKSSCASRNEPSFTLRVRHDLIIVSDGLEIGCGEVEPPCTDNELLEEDRARIAEIMKSQLHVRIMHAKDIKEFATFGLVFNGSDIELSVMVLNPEDYSYDHYELDTLKLLTTHHTHTNLEETLEILLSFKTLMVSSLPLYEDMAKPLNFPDYDRHFKSTISFINE